MHMSDVERMTITLTTEMARAVKGAVAAGEYASSSEIVREALRHWRRQRELQARELEALRADVQAGMGDVEAGRVHDFDAERIAKKGRQRLNTPDAYE
jgi:antitoxin ParD1/3/4